MFEKNKRKIFCIGFNKTGTSSLHDFFIECGLGSIHNDSWPNYTKVDNGKKYFNQQCYSDGEQSDFVQLDNWFPGSLFIFNTRDEKSWLYSRVKHVMRYNENVNLSTIHTNNHYGKMARDFFFDEKVAISKWLAEYKIYRKQVESYFDGRNDLLVLDVTKENWKDKILQLLNEQNYRHNVPNLNKQIHSNKRHANDLKNQMLLNKYISYVDEILAD
jgi:hypothetical protein